MVLQAFDLTKAYQGTPILNGVTFHLVARDRVGLVGANGCGKSTLMQILAGRLESDGGRLQWVTPGLTRGYLSQAGHFDPDRELGAQLAGVPDDLLARCGIAPAWLTRRAGTLSGGQKTRAALARVLATRPDVLLLDEPTNHLDAEGLAWLEQLLAGYRGAVLVVSHDRWFLDRIATRILELEHGTVRDYPGNYSSYARQKQLERESAREEYRQYVKEKQKLEEAIRRQRSWAESVHNEKLTGEMKNAKAHYKAQAKAHMQVARAMENRLERIRVEKPRDAAQLHLQMNGGGSGARNLLLAENLGFRYEGGRWLFRGAGFYVQRGDRVAVAGPNGAGKTTLLKLILGDLAPTEGTLYRSPLQVAYLAQELEMLNPANTVLEEATGNAAADQAYARSLLGCLLFSGDDVRKPVAALSGGEKVRLALAKILLAAPDLLVLDEPTNGLDLPARERIEEALDQYGGTLLLVSHDRYLLERLATRVIGIEGGRLTPFDGSYREYLNRRDSRDEGNGDRAGRRLLLETRLAQLSAALGAPRQPEEEKERLNAEFIALSRELRALRA